MATDLTTARDRRPTGRNWKQLAGVGTELVVNVGIPYLIFTWAEPSMGDVRGLLASSVPPILWSLVEFVRRRRVDAISLLALAGIVLSLLAFFGGGSVQMLQMREKLVTGVIGIVLLGSVAIGRPLFHEFAEAGIRRAGGEMAGFVEDYGPDLFRRRLNLITAVWGLGLVIDVAVSCVLVFSISIRSYLLVNPLLGYAAMGLLAAWTFAYARRTGLNGHRANLVGHER
jgi:hypothetical protein